MKQQSDVKTHSSGRRLNAMAVCLCVIGIAINFVLAWCIEQTGLPIYLDTIGTLLVSIMGGYLPGIIVGFITNLMKGIFDPSSLYYGILNVLIAVAAAFLSNKGYFKVRKPHRILISILVFTAIGGGLGTLMPWYLDGVSFEGEAVSEWLLNTGHFNLVGAELTANLILDFIDKTISVLLVLVIVRILPERIRGLFRFHGWEQTPLSDEETAAARNSNSRVMSLRTKIMLVLMIALLSIAAAATVISQVLFRRSIESDHAQLADGVARLAASVIDPEQVESFLAEGEAADGYRHTEQLLYNIRASSPDIQYIYVYQIQEDGCHVVFDLDTEDLVGDAPGSVIPFDPTFEPYLPKLLKGEPIEPLISDDRYGWLMTVYTPIYNSAGKCVCYAAADVSMKQLALDERSFFGEMVALFLSFFIVIFVVVWWLIEYHIILPVNTMAMRAGAFAYNSEEARELSVEGIRDLRIRTGDEVENLYHAFLKTSEDSMSYVADIQDKTETIEKMQRALIMVLADMVESRDKNTGDHIRKTAAYTEIILREMRKKGYYADQLTDRFVYDVVSSAPLHDIGKIQVPDAILNKPGRLTDEEFDKMKRHTTAGEEIISQVIALIPESGYLEEAKRLAGYHHEKWDGTGYPHGTAGEDIPLSARVMAVADVFDALVSNRSYKKAFPFEKAIEIIKEGSGKHFDPKIVDAFLAAQDEIEQISQEFGKIYTI